MAEPKAEQIKRANEIIKEKNSFLPVFTGYYKKYLDAAGVFPSNIHEKFGVQRAIFQKNRNCRVRYNGENLFMDEEYGCLSLCVAYLILLRVNSFFKKNKQFASAFDYAREYACERKLFNGVYSLVFDFTNTGGSCGGYSKGIVEMRFFIKHILYYCLKRARLLEKNFRIVMATAKGKNDVFCTVDHEISHLQTTVNVTLEFSGRSFSRTTNVELEIEKNRAQMIKMKAAEIFVAAGKGASASVSAAMENFPSEYSKTDDPEFVAECRANSKASLFSKIKADTGLKMKSFKDYKDLENIVLKNEKNKDNSEKAIRIKKHYDAVDRYRYFFGFAYRILEAERKI